MVPKNGPKQGRRDDFESGGPDINIEKVGPYRPKKWGGPTIYFTLFPPKSGGARAPPAHTLTTPLSTLVLTYFNPIYVHRYLRTYMKKLKHFKGFSQ